MDFTFSTAAKKTWMHGGDGEVVAIGPQLADPAASGPEAEWN
jgi:hypothetical protein